MRLCNTHHLYFKQQLWGPRTKHFFRKGNPTVQSSCSLTPQRVGDLLQHLENCTTQEREVGLWEEHWWVLPLEFIAHMLGQTHDLVEQGVLQLWAARLCLLLTDLPQ